MDCNSDNVILSFSTIYLFILFSIAVIFSILLGVPVLGTLSIGILVPARTVDFTRCRRKKNVILTSLKKSSVLIFFEF